MTRWIVLAAAGSLVGVVGCGGGPVPVEGTVHLDGAPLEGATVVFTPADPGDGGRQLASAVTDREGRFRLETANQSGAVAGVYRVSVSKREFPPNLPPPKTPMEAEQRHLLKKDLVPARYSDPIKTELRVEVARGGNRSVALELSSK